MNKSIAFSAFCKLAMPVSLIIGCVAPAHALTLTPTFEGAGYTAAAKSEINTALQFYQSTFSDDVSLTIKFVNTGVGSSIGMSNQGLWNINYSDYLSALRNDATSADDTVALEHIPNGTGSLPSAGQNTPVPGTNDQVWLTRANAAAIGISVGTVPDGVTAWDAQIDLNLGLMSFDHANPANDKYDLRTTAMHEINEVLGSLSNLKDFATGNDNGIEPADLFRYDNLGARNYTPDGDNAYFSLDGSNLLARYNQDSGGDYGDFWSSESPSASRPFQVQDAFNSTGYAAEMDVETRMLDAVGYTLIPTAVPVPGAVMFMLSGLGLFGANAMRRKIS